MGFRLNGPTLWHRFGSIRLQISRHISSKQIPKTFIHWMHWNFWGLMVSTLLDNSGGISQTWSNRLRWWLDSSLEDLTRGHDQFVLKSKSMDATRPTYFNDWSVESKCWCRIQIVLGFGKGLREYYSFDLAIRMTIAQFLANPRLNLVEKLVCARISSSTDPRDKVFSLLGILDDMDDFKPDYNLTTQKVYHKLGEYLISAGWDGFLLSAAGTHQITMEN